MTLVLAGAVFVLVATGVYLLLSRRLLRVVLGLALLAHAGNLVVLSAGGWGPRPPVLAAATDGAAVADPLPQALVLTAIVISMAVTLYLLALLAATGRRLGSALVGRPPASDAGREPAAVAAELSGRPPRHGSGQAGPEGER